MDLERLRRILQSEDGPRFWRSLDEVAETEEFRRFAEDEFPNRTPDWNDAGSRRRFLTLMGASLALAGASACTKQPDERIVPYVRQPENLVPGRPQYYATAYCQQGLATGLLVESHLGRPTKIEGNPAHPASMGATDASTQASILTLYDPDRSRVVLHNGYVSNWGAFLTALSAARDEAGTRGGEGLRLLTPTVTSPTLAAQLQQLLAAFPGARWHQWDACGQHAERAGSMAAFGAYWSARYRFDRAVRIVSLDSDFLGESMPGHVRYMRDYTARRRAAAENSGENAPRLYVAEAAPTITGGMAEHRLRMRAVDVEAFAFDLMAAADGGGSARAKIIWRDLDLHRGGSVVVPGEFQTAAVHCIAHELNRRLGSVGSTVVYSDRAEANPTDQVASVRALVDDMRAKKVRALVMLGGNPVYDAPADLDFLDAMKQVALRVHVGLYVNETAEWCQWHVPEAHYLESWSDARAWDGTTSIIQPLIEPMYHGRTWHDVLNVLNNRADHSAHDLVQEYWRGQHRGGDFNEFWRRSLHDGVVAGSALPEKQPPAPRVPGRAAAAGGGVEVVLRPDPTVGDGEGSNNAWLQELPKHQNKMTWDNAIWMSPRTAERLRLDTGAVVELTVGGRKVRGPCWIQPGQADESLTLHFGYGRTRAGNVGNGIGFNAYAVRTAGALAGAVGCEVGRTKQRHEFATTQMTQTMEGRDPYRVGTLAEWRANPRFARHEEAPSASLFPQWPYPAHKWGMAIDLTSCTGCNACMVACQSENNIAVVGKEQVAMGRHMNWLRVDGYFAGSLDDPSMYFQPVTCMHCETAPCELVCPVAATVHSGEGLNEMVYNRCVGTRYCSNNCPYKVRRFNFFLYADWETASLRGMRNPDVSVRSRGVMEKCSYCVQRIQEVRIEAEKQNNRAIRDGEIVTACQQVCPANAIVFGDLNDPKSEVARRKRAEREYGLLEELNTRPRTSYLARLTNPNPEMERA